MEFDYTCAAAAVAREEVPREQADQGPGGNSSARSEPDTSAGALAGEGHGSAGTRALVMVEQLRERDADSCVEGIR